MSDSHIHKFLKPQIIIIERITNDSYKGTAGDKSILVKACSCGLINAFDCGETKTMKAKLKELK